MMLLKKTNISFEGLNSNIITSVTARPIRLRAMLVIMSCLDLHNCRYSILVYNLNPNILSCVRCYRYIMYNLQVH